MVIQRYLRQHQQRLFQDSISYGVLLLFAASGILYGTGLLTQYTGTLRVWPWSTLLWVLCFLPIVWLSPAAGLPGWWQPKQAARNRFWMPLGIGLFFGALDVWVIKLLMHPEPYTELPPFLQPFPYAIWLYGSGAFEIEVFYRLLPLTLFGLLGMLWKRGRYHTTLLWVASILTALREPLEQWPSDTPLFIAYAAGSGFLMNLMQARLMVNYGFVASLVLRLGHYLLWHILLGVYVQYVELA